MEKIDITMEDGRRLSLAPGAAVGSLAPEPLPHLPWLAALVNNDVSSLSYPLTVNSEVKFLAMDSPHGWRVYRRSLCFLLAKTVREVFPDAKFSVEHSFGVGLYCSFRASGGAREGMTADDLECLKTRMRELIEQNLPIERRKIGYGDAVREFANAAQNEKLNLLRFRNPPRVVVYWCQGFSDLAHGPLAPATGVLRHFDLIRYPPGFVLHLPDRGNTGQVPPFEDQPHLFRIFQEHKEWGRILEVTRVGRLNELVAGGEFEPFVRIAEALHEKKVARIADQIAAAGGRIKVVLIAGPSSAGKTTFAKRLGVQLRVNGLRTVAVSTDDYFVGEDRNPRDEAGNPDYEHLEAVDIALFNDQLNRLIGGETAELPTFNFQKKQREYRGRKLHLDDGGILIVEGIHGLNPRLTHRVPTDRKFRIYVSSLTQLNIDSNNRISTTDNRLMRRMIRDHLFRGYSALETLRRWPSVRNGEKTWVFPFQREADATFNSALDYELAVLKPFIEPLLMEVKPAHPEYAEARRLSEFLLNFLAAGADAVPGTSILREYIGGSRFDY